MELHDLISSNQLGFTECPVDAPDSYFPEIKMSSKKAKFKVDSTSLGCYVNSAFMANECILENQLNHSRETCFNGNWLAISKALLMVENLDFSFKSNNFRRLK